MAHSLLLSGIRPPSERDLQNVEGAESGTVVDTWGGVPPPAPRETRPARDDGAEPSMNPSAPHLTNVQAIMDLERRTRAKRSTLDRVTDAVSALASSPAFIAVHVVWFAVWIGVNSIGRATFDRYPFNLLTLVVSLEAIVLTGFVLMAQSRMTREADKRAHLDLQINLLAEQELTAILTLQCRLAERAGIDVSDVDPRLEQLQTRTDVQQLAATIATEMASTSQDDPDGPNSSNRTTEVTYAD
jgi:uncharacterized membrane protein